MAGTGIARPPRRPRPRRRPRRSRPFSCPWSAFNRCSARGDLTKRLRPAGHGRFGAVENRPYVLLSCALSLDGHIDDTGEERLLLSDEADFDRVDEVRAGSDAILVGAGTVRRDDPRLLVRDETRRRERTARGLPEHPVKVVLTAAGDLDPDRRFFTLGHGEKLVYTTDATAPDLRARLGDAATVVGLGTRIDLPTMLADLHGRGVRRLMVEGGGHTHTAFLTAGLVDELRLVIAPFLVGESEAPRFVYPGDFPYGPDRPLRLTGVTRLGHLVLLTYRTPEDDG
ncbi:MAG: deaminase [Streptosporangiales bacterium]|nr:deaminase [Streptosporangiales bacterium]